MQVPRPAPYKLQKVRAAYEPHSSIAKREKTDRPVPVADGRDHARPGPPGWWVASSVALTPWKPREKFLCFFSKTQVLSVLKTTHFTYFKANGGASTLFGSSVSND